MYGKCRQEDSRSAGSVEAQDGQKFTSDMRVGGGDQPSHLLVCPVVITGMGPT